jgi:hypothetical protein
MLYPLSYEGMAERMGFEPMDPKATRLAGEHDKPDSVTSPSISLRPLLREADGGLWQG